ncbi:cytochrome P450 [Actinoplanes lobatus]|uniref:Cytochrome P450 n=1 Tax=Actinoplanes lobatus TaxID=113568 RepID=A0A7W7MHW2_9ACTN|nr:cytochrome P450 [Actinoplanes lobatus]MBB4750887.1 cytochrome P450 [Actinoplanes lobatus]GGN92193.1 cytochrome P450 [Actinoplanes lobatus]GIE44440.1 cytochrome P450 [Actinoplanes lobatus]
MPETQEIQRFPFPTALPAEPAPRYAELRNTEPVSPVLLPTGHAGWVVTRYDDVRAVCTDARFSKQAVTEPGAPRLLPIFQELRSIVVMDAPEHTRLRKLVVKAFSARRVESLRPYMRQVTEELIAAMTAGPPEADVVAAVAMPLPIKVICELLGVPFQDREQFRIWGDAVVGLSGSAGGPDAVKEAAVQLFGYLDALIDSKRRTPADDLLTALLAAHEADDRLSAEELRVFALTLLMAGYHTTASAISQALFHLLRRPESYRSLVGAPGDVLDRALEELLRYSQVANGLGAMRIALEDVELSGVLIRKGDAVVPAFGSANRDGAVFPDADRLVLDRQDNPHISFGAGIHYCLGAQLARAEMQILLATLTERLPTLSLVNPDDPLTWTTPAFPRPAAMLVRW